MISREGSLRALNDASPIASDVQDDTRIKMELQRTSGVVPSVLESRQSVAQGLSNVFTVLFGPGQKKTHTHTHNSDPKERKGRKLKIGCKHTRWNSANMGREDRAEREKQAKVPESGTSEDGTGTDLLDQERAVGEDSTE